MSGLQVNWPFPPQNKIPVSWSISSKFVMGAVGLLSKFWIGCLNKMTVYNKEVLWDALDKRPAGQGLVTISNHQSCLDDPVVWGFLKLRHVTTGNHVMRWTLAAADICFTKERHAKFFALGRTVPICRGDGVYQKSMDFMLDKLNNGAWVHTFPEGKVNGTPDSMRLKWGIGRLIADCTQLPLVIPVWHLGMDDILPNKEPYIPRIGKILLMLDILQKVTIFIGQPMDFSDQLETLRKSRKTPKEIRKSITDRIQEEFRSLQSATEKLHLQCSPPR